MGERSAKIISVLIHPIFTPLFALYLIFHADSYLNYNAPWELKKFLYLFTFSLLVLMPVLSLWILVRNGMVSSFMVPGRKERTAPYLITVFYYLLFYFLIKRIPYFPGTLLSIMLGGLLLVLFIFIINHWYKVSSHSAGIFGLVGTYIALSANTVIIPDRILLTGLILLAGMVGTARLSLGVHRAGEVFLGAFLGFSTMFLMVWLQLFF